MHSQRKLLAVMERRDVFKRWASMNLVDLMRFEDNHLGQARQEAARIAALIDFPIVEDLDEKN